MKFKGEMSIRTGRVLLIYQYMLQDRIKKNINRLLSLEESCGNIPEMKFQTSHYLQNSTFYGPKPKL